RLGSTLFAIFGALSVTLALIGLYAIASYQVAQQTNEIGVRLALGATATRVARMILARGASLIALGTAGGLLLVLALARLVAPLLFHTEPTEPTVLLVVVALMAAGGVLATALPAVRASQIDPGRALNET